MSSRVCINEKNGKNGKTLIKLNLIHKKSICSANPQYINLTQSREAAKFY